MIRKLIVLLVGTMYLTVGLGGVIIPVPSQDGRTLHQALVHGSSGWIECVAMWLVCPTIILTSVLCICAVLLPPIRPPRTN